MFLMGLLAAPVLARAGSIAWIGTAGPNVIVVVADARATEGTPATGASSWRINGVQPAAVGRWSYVQDEGPVVADSAIHMRHHIYLVSNAALVSGSVYNLATPFGPAVFTFVDDSSLCEAIKVNQVGYRGGGAPRIAMLGVMLGNLGSRAPVQPPTYRVVDVGNGMVVARGTAVFRKADTGSQAMSGEYAYVMDLAGVPDGGPYRVVVDGWGCSYPFGVGAEYMRQLYRVHARGLYHQRCGIALETPYTEHTRPMCHAGVEITDAEPEGFITAHGPLMEIHGGYHDAGDFDRRPGHTLIPAWMLMTYEAFPDRFADAQLNIPESGNGIPDWLDESIWGVLVWAYLQTPEGGVRAGTEADRHPTYGEVNAATDWLTYRTYRVDGFTTATACGLFAQVSRLLRPFDTARARAVLDRATRAWGYMRANALPNMHAAPRMYAALQLYLATGDQTYHQAFLADARLLLAGAPYPQQYNPFYWSANTIRDGQIFAPYFFSYLITSLPTDSVVRNGLAGLIAARANDVLGAMQASAYPNGSTYAPAWGTATAQGRYAEPLLLAYRLGGNRRLLDAAGLLADYCVGLNPLGRCWVTGLGAQPPSNPTHLDSYFTRERGLGPVPGIVPYGPFEAPGEISYQKIIWSKVYPAWDRQPLHRRYSEGWSLIPVNEFTTLETMVPNACMFAVLAESSTASGVPGGHLTNPDATVLRATCSPNVVAGPATIRLAGVAGRRVTLDLVDPGGRIVARLLHDAVVADDAPIAFSATDALGVPLASGLYRLRVAAGEQSAIIPIMIVR